MEVRLKNSLLVWEGDLLCFFYYFNYLTDGCMRLENYEHRNILRLYHLLLNGNVYSDKIIIKEESERINIHLIITWLLLCKLRSWSLKWM